MLNVNIIDNFRTFDENDGYETEYICDNCEKPSEIYIKIEDSYICKSCLCVFEQLWNDRFIEHTINEQRK